jgi:Ser/Thr protein kinase RdoA (MazF antagonist)
MAVTFSTLLARPDLPALIAGALHGYRQVRPLTAAHEALLPTFVAARLYGHTHWLAALQDQAVFGDGARMRVTRQIGYLRRFLAGYPLPEWATT